MPKTQGYDHFENVPLADIQEQRWVSIVEACGPILRGVVYIGISAVQASAEKANSHKATEIVESGALLDESGLINRELAQEFNLGTFPRPSHLELGLAGLFIVSAAVQATKLFRNHPIEHEDYEGQTGVRFVQRTTLASVNDPDKSQELGRKLNTYPVRNLQAKAFLSAKSVNTGYGTSELTLAASLHGPGRRSSSMSSVLHISASEQGVASAQLTSGYRDGDFVSPDSFVNFINLYNYAEAIASLKAPDVRSTT